MSYFSYHGKIKKLLKEDQLDHFELVDVYNGIKPALVIYFKNHKPMPVREHRFDEYFELLSELQAKKN